MPAALPARAGVDVGGTFTDVVVAHATGLTVWKVPSTPEDQSGGFERGLREALERAGSPPLALAAHGTTVATNAVLERRGARIAFVTTAGFRDLLAIGRQSRPSLYDLWADRPEPLVPRERCVGVRERTGGDGAPVVRLSEEAAAEAVAAALATDPEAVAVCLLFSFANPAHERAIRDLIAARAPGVRVSLSSDVLPEFREYERASTTTLDAYVGPIVERYVARLAGRARREFGAPVAVMRSGGGTMSAEQAARDPVHTLLSGPAAGVRGAALAARAAGISDIVTFDMGGTSTDVCLVERGEPAIATESAIGGLPFRTPTLAIHTVGAGGGSVLWLDAAGALRAGPRSAGAEPGPACYGRGGGEAAVTDAHAALGHLDPDAFLGGRMRLDVPAARRALGTIAATLGAAVETVAEAGLGAVRAHMAKAIRVVTVERGRHPRDFALVAFGGAGPMHATALADELEIATVLVPPAAGALSALGLLTAPLTADASRTEPVTDPSTAGVEAIFDRLAARAASALRAQGAEPTRVALAADCRYLGQAHEVTVDAGAPGAVEAPGGVAERFHAEHRARFGWDAPGEPVEWVTFRARATGAEPELELPRVPRGAGARPTRSRRARIGGQALDAPVYARAALGAGDRVAGPALVLADESTAVVEAGWHAEVDGSGTLVVTRR